MANLRQLARSPHRSRQLEYLVTLTGGIGSREVDLQHDVVRVVQEDLAQRHPRNVADGILGAGPRRPLDELGKPRAGEGDMIDRARSLLNRRVRRSQADEMDDRLVAEIEPCSGERKFRPEAAMKSEDRLI